MSAASPDTPQDGSPEGIDFGSGAPPPDAVDAHSDPSRAESPLSVPAVLAQHHRYRILELIESGGMGTVFKAEHQYLKRLVALKVIKKGRMQSPQLQARFFTEMQAAAQLSHPNIVAIYDADVVGDTSFLVMELVDGVSLHQLVQDQ